MIQATLDFSSFTLYKQVNPLVLLLKNAIEIILKIHQFLFASARYGYRLAFARRCILLDKVFDIIVINIIYKSEVSLKAMSEIVIVCREFTYKHSMLGSSAAAVSRRISSFREPLIREVLCVKRERKELVESMITWLGTRLRLRPAVKDNAQRLNPGSGTGNWVGRQRKTLLSWREMAVRHAIIVRIV